jgi:hypothetical protein
MPPPRRDDTAPFRILNPDGSLYAIVSPTSGARIPATAFRSMAEIEAWEREEARLAALKKENDAMVAALRTAQKRMEAETRKRVVVAEALKAPRWAEGNTSVASTEELLYDAAKAGIITPQQFADAILETPPPNMKSLTPEDILRMARRPKIVGLPPLKLPTWKDMIYGGSGSGVDATYNVNTTAVVTADTAWRLPPRADWPAPGPASSTPEETTPVPDVVPAQYQRQMATHDTEV